ncbi:tetratricopeptide repeat protein [Halomonadaceae bacterium KBTZ08]
MAVRLIKVSLLVFALCVPSVLASPLDRAREVLAADRPGRAEAILSESLSSNGVAEGRRDELFFLLAETARQYGHFSEAGNQLNRIDDPLWGGMGYYNLAMAYLERESLSRARAALRVVRSLASGDGSLKGADLVSRAHIAEGLMALRGGNPERAERTLKRVRTDSTLVSEGLYLLGVARARSGRLHRALQTWERAEGFPVAWPGVVEARLARVWGYSEFGHHGEALITAERNHAFLERSLKKLNKLMGQVQEKGVARLIRSQLEGDQVLVEFLRGSRDHARSPLIAWVLEYVAHGGDLTAARAELDAGLLAFLEAERERLSGFRDRNLRQQALVYEEVALRQTERPVQRGGWE